MSKGLFDTAHLKTDLKTRSVRGGAATLAGQGALFMLQMGATVVLARLLTPADFGLLAMVTAVTGFLMMFKDMGLSMATVQQAEITHEQVSTLFWVNVVVSVGIMLATAALAPALAWFYDEPRLTWVTMALAMGIVRGGLTMLPQALLRRQMRFGALAIIQVSATTFGIGCAITAAVLGAGYWSLVVLQLGTALGNAVLVWGVCRWIPGRPVRGAGARAMVAFGGHLTGFNVTNYFARNLDKVLIGWWWKAGPLGLYSKAYGLLMLPLRQLNMPLAAVAIPALSRLQDEPARYRNYYYKALTLLAMVTMPGVMFLVVMSEEVVLLVLGDQWLGAAPVFSILGLAALYQPVLSSVGWVYVSTGRTDRMFKWGVIASTVTALAVAVGVPFGIEGVAAAYVSCSAALFVPGLWYACKPSPVSLRGIALALWPTAVATVAVGGAMLGCRHALPALVGSAAGLAAALGLAALLFLASLCILARSLQPLRDLADPLSHIFRRTGGAAGT